MRGLVCCLDRELPESAWLSDACSGEERVSLSGLLGSELGDL